MPERALKNKLANGKIIKKNIDNYDISIFLGMEEEERSSLNLL